VFFGKRTRPLIVSEPVDTSSATADLLLTPVQSAEQTATSDAPIELSTKDLERVAALAWRVLRRLGVGEHLVADAVQDALVVVHRRLPEFRGQSKFETWVYGILLRVASDYRRKHRRAARVFADVEVRLDQDIRCEAANPFEQLEQQEAADFIKGLLDQLPESVRDVFVLVELEELSLGAAAQALDISDSTAKSRLRSARKGFETALKRELARRSSGQL
jgi:RNA polymerase sigma-70 factor (ECF subfamily)